MERPIIKAIRSRNTEKILNIIRDKNSDLSAIEPKDTWREYIPLPFLAYRIDDEEVFVELLNDPRVYTQTRDLDTLIWFFSRRGSEKYITLLVENVELETMLNFNTPEVGCYLIPYINEYLSDCLHKISDNSITEDELIKIQKDILSSEKTESTLYTDEIKELVKSCEIELRDLKIKRLLNEILQ